MLSSGSAGGGGRKSAPHRSSPFTPSQWQELEHQALIFKYMATGVPIPADLLLPLRRHAVNGASSFLLDPSVAAFPGHLTSPWGCGGFPVTMAGRKPEDAEPGRCRRTDGKKWRCSKEAYPNSKYCEKHMHRGKNRSRKPMETSPSTLSSAAAGTAAHHLPPPSMSLSTAGNGKQDPNHRLFPYKPCAASAAIPRHWLNCHAPFFSDGLEWPYAGGGGSGDGAPHLTSTKHGAAPFNDGGYFTVDLARETEEEEHERAKQSQAASSTPVPAPHCFVLGTDLLQDRTEKTPDSALPSAQKPLRHFFGEWPPTELRTQLSISMPTVDAIPVAADARFRHDE